MEQAKLGDRSWSAAADHRGAPPHRASPASLFCVFVMLQSSFFVFLRPITVLGLSASSLLTTTIVVVAGWLLLAHRLTKRDLSGVTLPLMLLICWGVVSMVGVHAPSQEGVQSLLVLLVTYLLMNVGSFARGWDPTFARKLNIACLFTVGLGAIPILLWGQTGGRSIPAILLIPLAWVLTQQRAAWRGWVLPGFVVLVILLSNARTALGASIVLLVSAHPAQTVGQKIRVVLAAASMALVAWGAVNYYQPLKSHFFQGDVSFRLGGVNVNGNGRTKAWGIVWDSFVESPLVGHGPGSGDVLIATKLPGRGLDHPHNDYLRLLHDYGVFGLALWAAFVWRCTRRLRRIGSEEIRDSGSKSRFTRAAQLVLLAMSLMMTTDNVLIYSFFMAPGAIILGAGMTDARGSAAPTALRWTRR